MTGAAISVMSEQQWNTLFPEAETLPPYTGQPMRGYSGHQLDRKWLDKQWSMCNMTGNPLVVMEGIHKPGWHQSRYNGMRYTKFSQTAYSRYSALFVQSVGTIQGYTADIRLKPDATPVVQCHCTLDLNSTSCSTQNKWKASCMWRLQGYHQSACWEESLPTAHSRRPVHTDYRRTDIFQITLIAGIPTTTPRWKLAVISNNPTHDRDELFLCRHVRMWLLGRSISDGEKSARETERDVFWSRRVQWVT